jgi:hypothetical protein
MRFPFTLMGVVAAGAGLWTFGYLAAMRQLDGFTQGVAGLSGLSLLALGAYLIYRRLRHGPQG